MQSLHKFSIIIGITTLLCSQYTYAQRSKPWLSFNAGLNLARTSFIYINRECFEKSIPAYQLGINKDFFPDKPFGASIGIGLSKYSFNAGRQIGQIHTIKQLDFSYAGFETGPVYRIPVKNIVFWCSTRIRISRLLSSNFHNYYTLPSLSNRDIGMNLNIGCQFTNMARRPYILLNYYRGLTKIAKNSVVSADGEFLDDSIRNRSMGIQIGFHL